MRILAITSSGEDYLADMVLYGLRKQHGAACVDWPKKDVMYKSCLRPTGSLYGRGFTMWKLLDDIVVDRERIEDRLAAKAFDVVVFTSIHRQRDQYTVLDHRGLLDRIELRFLDGEDLGYLPIDELLSRGAYFKREEPFVQNVMPISFAIPKEKLLATPAAKTRFFATHVQCEEAYRHPWIALHCRGRPGEGYAFEDEAAYRADFATSNFAITGMKAGWDCLRHYEQAANFAVPCFYQLGSKTRASAPHGLVDGVNCVAFDTCDELVKKTTVALEDGSYERLMRGAGAWAAERTCEALADYVLRAVLPGPFGP
jgi:hypothetical protein